jgi:mRNA-degrading endonuclease RelE of RelBE toxin-antitoxin system
MPLNPKAVPLRLVYKDMALEKLEKMPLEEAEQINQSLQRLALTGHGDTEMLRDEYISVFRLRVGKRRIFFDLVSQTRELVVQDIENRGQAYTKKARAKGKR